MAIRNDKLGGTDIQANEVELKSADWNDTFDASLSKILTVDGSTDLNVSGEDGNDNTTTKTFSFSSSDFSGASYIMIEFNGNINGQSNVVNANLQLEIEGREQGGTYSTQHSPTLANYDSTERISINQNKTFKYYYELSSGELSNGVDLRISFSTNTEAQGGGDNSSISYSNHQTIFRKEV